MKPDQVKNASQPDEGHQQGREMSGATMTLDEIMAPIRAGRRDLLPVLRSILERNPHLWEEQGDVARRSLGSWIVRISDNDELIKEQMLLRTNQMRNELLGPDPTAAERLLVERVLVLQQQVAYFEMLEASGTEELTRTKLGAAVNKRQEQANRQLSDAIRQLQIAQKLQLEITPTRPGTASAIRVFNPEGKRRTA
jgi:hypothetical protein